MKKLTIKLINIFIKSSFFNKISLHFFIQTLLYSKKTNLKINILKLTTILIPYNLSFNYSKIYLLIQTQKNLNKILFLLKNIIYI